MVEIVQDLKPKLKWYVGTKDKYDALTNIDPKGLYFLLDEGSIIKNKKSFNAPITLFETGKLPMVGANGRLYVDSTSLEGYSYTDGKWSKTLTSITSATSLDDESTKVVGSVAKEIADKAAASISVNAVTDISYDKDTNTLNYTKNGNILPLKLDGVASQLKFDLDTLTMSTVQSDGTVLSSVKISDSHVIGGKYDDDRKAIIFNMRDGSEVRLKAYALINMFHGAATATMTNVVHNYIDGKNVLSCFVNVSKEPDNYLSISEDEDGIFAKIPGDSLTGIREDELYKVVNEIMVPAGTRMFELATEALVQKMKDDVLAYLQLAGANWLKTDNIVADTVNKEDPLSSKVPSFTSINYSCGLKRL